MFRKVDNPDRIETEARRGQRTVQREHTRDLNKMHARNRAARKKFFGSKKATDFEIETYLGIDDDAASPTYGQPIVHKTTASVISNYIDDLLAAARAGTISDSSRENLQFLSEEYGPVIKAYKDKISYDADRQAKVDRAAEAKTAFNDHKESRQNALKDAKKDFKRARTNRRAVVRELTAEAEHDDRLAARRIKRRLSAFRGGITSRFMGASQLSRLSKMSAATREALEREALLGRAQIESGIGSQPNPADVAEAARAQYLRQALASGQLDPNALATVQQATLDNVRNPAAMKAWAEHADRTPEEKAAMSITVQAGLAAQQAVSGMPRETAHSYAENNFADAHLALAKAREEAPRHEGWFGTDFGVRNTLGIRPKSRHYKQLEDAKKKAEKAAGTDLVSILVDSVTFKRSREMAAIHAGVGARDRPVERTLVENLTMVTDNLPLTTKTQLTKDDAVDLLQQGETPAARHGRKVVAPRALGLSMTRTP